MEINWQAPFQLAWDLGLFLLGSILILLVVIIAVLVTYGLVKGFVLAIKRARTPKGPEAPTPNLKAVK
jgi:hypothetical protein